MGKRAWLWVTGTAVALLAAAWVSGAGPIAALTNPGLSPTTDNEFGEDTRGDVGDNRQGAAGGPETPDSDFIASVVSWTFKVVIALIVLLVLGLIARQILRLLRGDSVTVKEDAAAPVLPEVLLQGVRESQASLDSGTVSDAIINAWLGLERTSAEVGLEDDLARTPAELVSAVLTQFDVEPSAITELAELYREARFSTHEMGEADREAARAALARVHTDLTRPLGLLGATS